VGRACYEQCRGHKVQGQVTGSRNVIDNNPNMSRKHHATVEMQKNVTGYAHCYVTKYCYWKLQMAKIEWDNRFTVQHTIHLCSFI